MKKVKAVKRKTKMPMKRILFLSLTLALTNCSELLTHRFHNSVELCNSKVYQNGWITVEIPRSAYNIKVMNDLDTNKAWMRFSFKNNDFHLKKGVVLSDQKLYHSILDTLGEEPKADDVFYGFEDQLYLIVSHQKNRLVYYKEF